MSEIDEGGGPIASSRLEDCFSGSCKYRYSLPFAVDDLFLGELARGGKVTAFKSLPRPYFTCELENGVRASGALGERAIKVVYPVAGAERFKADFEAMLAAYASSAPGRAR